jgi:hypothetical protein
VGGTKCIPLPSLSYIAQKFPCTSSELHPYITVEWVAKPPPEVCYIAHTSACNFRYFHGHVTAGPPGRRSCGGTLWASAIYTIYSELIPNVD